MLITPSPTATNDAIIAVFTRDEAMQLGLLVCANCGWPENNHFSFGTKVCAHDASCPGYRDKLRFGKLFVMQENGTT